MFRHFSAITIGCHRTSVCFCNFRICQIINIISHGQYKLVRHQSLFYQIKDKHICHLPDHQPCLVKYIWTLQHLTGTKTTASRFIGLDRRHGTRFPSPGVIDQKFRIHTKKTIQQIFIVIIIRSAHGTSGNISHGINAHFLQLSGIAPSHAPEIRQRTVVPEHLPITPLIQFRNPHAINIRLCMLSPNIHGHLTQIKIRTDSRGSRDSCCHQNIKNDFHGQFSGRHLIKRQILRGIDHHLIY